MVDESIPPDRNAPSGTSATIRIRTEARRAWSSASTASASEPSKRCATPWLATSRIDQYGVGARSTSDAAAMRNHDAGGSFFTPTKIEPGVGT